MKIAYIINHQALKQDRNKNLEIVIQHIKLNFPFFELVVIEQSPSLEFDYKNTDKVLKFKNDGYFLRCHGFNIGYRNTDADVLVFADNDILLNPESLNEAIENVIKNKGSASPYNVVYDLKEDDFKTVINFPLEFKCLNRVSRCGFYAGGVVILHREAFEKLGGWDERFIGWGGEDDQFYTKIKKLEIPVFVNKSSIAYHLHHTRIHDSGNNPNYSNNVKVWKETERIFKEHLEVLCSEQLKLIGKIKYDRYK
jgi:GT2 family glycosyltransferase